ncbi:MAG: DUF1934 domain-containing protein [Clostridia bacterium]|nr:DUF1934 domain-containing protein [Clostridia bacterium]
MEKKIKIHITSMQSELGETFLSQLFEESDEDFAHSAEAVKEQIESDDIRAEIEGAKMESSTEGTLVIEGGRATVRYDETELTGMEGATTQVSFALDAPGLVTMLRGGGVTTSLVFEQDKRHVSIYETPFMPFEICILTMKVENRLIEAGTLELDYVVEVKGAQAERTRFTMEISEASSLINPIKEYEE